MSVSPLMPGPIGPDTLGLYVTAFLDGELDAAGNLAVLEYVAAHPEALSLLETQKKLHDAARRTIGHGDIATPASLRAQIESFAFAESDEPAGPLPMDGGRFRLMRWVSFAAAAVVLLGLGMMAGRAMTPKEIAITTPPIQPDAGSVVPVALMRQVTRIHVDCSRFLAYHTGGYPATLRPLGDIVKADLSSDKPEPDLTSIGYTFVGAGPCGQPLDQTVHLLYRSSDTKPGKARDTLSVFVQPYTGQYAMDPGKPYLLTPADAPHPLLAWRSEKAVYFITGDDMAEVKAAAAKMPPRI